MVLPTRIHKAEDFECLFVEFLTFFFTQADDDHMRDFRTHLSSILCPTSGWCSHKLPIIVINDVPEFQGAIGTKSSGSDIVTNSKSFFAHSSQFPLALVVPS